MPTYEYACDACKHEFDQEQRISEDALKKCPKCGKLKLRRLITQGNFILKGSGWYADAYSGPSNQGASKAKEEAKDDKKPAAAEKSGSDEKPAPDKKKETKPKAD